MINMMIDVLFNKRLNNKNDYIQKGMKENLNGQNIVKKQENKVNEKIILNTACYLFVNQITIVKKKKK